LNLCARIVTFFLLISSNLATPKGSEDFHIQYQRRLSPALGVAVTELTCSTQLSCTLVEDQGGEKKQAHFSLTVEEKKEILKLLSELQRYEQGRDDTFRLSWKFGNKVVAHTVNMQNQKPVGTAAKLISMLEVHFRK